MRIQFSSMDVIEFYDKGIQIPREYILDRVPLEIIIQLSDNYGYSNEELSKQLNKPKSQISKVINDKLAEMPLILENDSVKIHLVHAEKNVALRKERDLKGSSGVFYYLGPKPSASSEEKLVVFRFILESSQFSESKLQEKLLASKYVNSLIADCDLEDFYGIMKKYMVQKEFSKIASRALLSQPALKDKYKKLPRSIRSYIVSDRRRLEKFALNLRNGYDTYWNILFEFNPIEAIKFYRSYLANDFNELFRELAEEENVKSINPYITDAMKKFFELDMFLSPRTSFPQNNPFILLFANPFERLYNDIYIIEDSDYERMVERAYLIYSHFAEILKYGIISMKYQEDYDDRIEKFISKSDASYLETKEFNSMQSLWSDLFSDKQKLSPLIEELIFYWNIASLRLDFIYHKQSYWKKKGRALSVAGFHLLGNSNGIEAIDINEVHVPGPGMTSEDMKNTSLCSADSNPFSNLRYCYCFKDLGLEEKQVSVEQIAADLEDIYSS